MFVKQNTVMEGKLVLIALCLPDEDGIIFDSS